MGKNKNRDRKQQSRAMAEPGTEQSRSGSQESQDRPVGQEMREPSRKGRRQSFGHN